jgi:hypothetical protein
MEGTVNRYTYPLLVAALVAVLLTPLFIHPGYLLYPRSGQATDLTITHWPAVAYNVRSLRQDGQIPLWRTTIAGGGPWLANPQSWLLYPPAWLFFLLPINLTFNLLLVSHLLLAALGTYALGRRALGLGPAGSALAGLAFALTPWLSGQLAAGHINIALALAWLPVALLGAHRAAVSDRSGGALLAGVAWTAALLNHAQMAAFIAALTLAWFLFSLRPGRRRWRTVVHLLALPATALLLGAALLVPLAEALPYLNRSSLTVQEAGIFSLSWPQLLTALVPTYGGEPEQVIYLGLPVAVLAAVGIFIRRDRNTWFFAGSAALAALLALGTHGPLFPILFRFVPGMGWLRVPTRAWSIVAFSLALLAGRGLDTLISSRLGVAGRRRVTWIALVTLVAGLVLAAGLALLYRPAPPATWALAALAVLTAAGLLLGPWLSRQPGGFALATLVLVAADLGIVLQAWTEMRAPADAFAWGAEPAAYLAQQPGQFRVYSPSYSLPQHTATAHGLFLADGVDPFQLAAYADFLTAAGGYDATGYSVTLPPRLDDAGARPDAALLGLLNVGYVASNFPIETLGLILQTKLDGTYIYRNERALPRAYVVTLDRVQGNATLMQPVEGTPTQIVTYTPNHITLKALADAPCLLVLSEVWYPGWQAKVDRHQVPIQRVDGVLRGVQLDVGQHIVEFRYTPWAVWIGVGISSITALALIVFGVLGRRRQV